MSINNSQNLTLAELMQRRMSRRRFVSSGAALGATALASPWLVSCSPKKDPNIYEGTLGFTEIAKADLPHPTVALGYQFQRLISWGDGLFHSTYFSPEMLTADGQAKRFGYNNDYLAYLPLPIGSQNSEHGLLCVNHEYANARLMFSGMTQDTELKRMTETQGRIQQEAIGCSVVEIRRKEGVWHVVPGSLYAQRITATTPIRISGPARAHKRLKTKDDPHGILVKGTVGNCAGGVTPWGTVLSAEENVDDYFANLPKKHRELRNLKRMGFGGKYYYNWHRFDDRFDMSKEPNEPNRFGWIVEYDPYHPEKPPVKRTALGRFKHECASVTLAPDGRVVVYSGDDEEMEYVYRFITDKPYHPDRRELNEDLLDHGTLSVARFLEDGMVEWLPLIYGKGKLNRRNGFYSQADVLIETRRAADLLGATPMDRPEDVEVNSATGILYVTLTKNSEREKDDIDASHRRAPNPYGHILELAPPLKDGKPDHAADMFMWGIFLEAGDPINPTHRAYYQGFVTQHGWLTNPDNVAFDRQGRIWIATDGQPASIGLSDSLYGADTKGAGRGVPRLFFNAPRGAEVTGPAFTPDHKTLFLSIQHPGDTSGSNFDMPSTRWPDFRDDLPPRPSVIAVTKEDGNIIGS